MAKVKFCAVFGARPVSEQMRPYFEGADCVIAADGGLMNLRALGVEPDVCLGDYDSGPMPEGREGVIVLPRQKDDTDMHYAARRILAMGAKRAVLLGGMGGRLDHTLANLATLVYLTEHGVDAVLADERCEARVLLRGEHSVPPRAGCYLSLFPVGGSARVTLRDVFYELQSETLTASFPLGVSNEFSDKNASITVEEGALYLLICKKEPERF